MEALRKLAMRYPEAQEGIACQGTPIEKSTIKARDKAFLFFSAKDAMVKLGESLPEATGLATREPSRYKVGAHGWVTITFGHGQSPPLDILERWIDESYRLVAHKQLVAMLPATGLPADAKQAAAKTTAKKASSSKKTVAKKTSKT